MKQSIRVKNRLYIKYTKVPTAQNEQNYLNCKSKIKTDRDHIESHLNVYRGNLSNSWGIMKDIINRNKMSITHPEYFDIIGKKVTYKNYKAKHFNEYYIDIGPNICNTLQKTMKSR